MTTGTGNRGEWLPHGASLQGHQSSTHTHPSLCREMLMSSNYRPETLKWSPSLDCFHLRLQTKDAEQETKEEKKKLSSLSYHVLRITAGEYAKTYLQRVTQAEWLCAERQTDSNWPTDLFQFETLGPALRRLQLLMPCGAAETRLTDLKISSLILESIYSWAPVNKNKQKR